MAILKIYKCFDSILREKAKKVDAISDFHLSLVNDMIETMYSANGIGLAAPQVGHSIRLIVCCPTLKKGEEIVLFNPVVKKTKGSCIFEEGCLSVPEVYAKVKRPAEIEVSGVDRRGNSVEVSASGMSARVLLHEIDHLDGILFVDRLSLLRRKLVWKRLEKSKTATPRTVK